ncbi:MAG TPA: hypothetical protein VGG20_24285 [Thermoanaerobaculia bacterium]|jgi:hypothetical protein
MKRNRPGKLALHRETLRNLDPQSLVQVRGLGPSAATTCCTVINCTAACSADCPPQSDDCSPSTGP